MIAYMDHRASVAFKGLTRGARSAPPEVQTCKPGMSGLRLDRVRADRAFDFLKGAPLKISSFAGRHFGSPSTNDVPPFIQL